MGFQIFQRDRTEENKIESQLVAMEISRLPRQDPDFNMKFSLDPPTEGEIEKALSFIFSIRSPDQDFNDSGLRNSNVKESTSGCGTTSSSYNKVSFSTMDP